MLQVNFPMVGFLGRRHDTRTINKYLVHIYLVISMYGRLCMYGGIVTYVYQHTRITDVHYRGKPERLREGVT